jgi:hypothetical protein
MSDNVFLIGNGESRKDFDLEQLRQHGKIYGCNALYRDFTPDVLCAVDHGISHEIYQSGYAKNNETWLRSWTKIPKDMFESMVFGNVTDSEINDFEKYDVLKQNKDQKKSAKEFVFHGSSLNGIVGVLRKGKDKEPEVVKKEINQKFARVSWIYENDKSHCLTEIMPNNKDRGWACGATSGYVACHNENPKSVFLLGHDLNSTTHQLNNIYKGTDHYGLSENSPIPSVNWITQWAHLFTENPLIKFYKVNKFGISGDNEVDKRIDEWSGIENLIYIDYPNMLDILGKR